MTEPYVCGPLMTQGAHQLGVNLLRSPISAIKAHMFTRFLESWCYDQCEGPWRIEQSDAVLMIYFDTDRDCVLFKMTPEWDYLNDNGPLDETH